MGCSETPEIGLTNVSLESFGIFGMVITGGGMELQNIKIIVSFTDSPCSDSAK